MSSEVFRSDAGDESQRGAFAPPPAQPALASPGQVLILTSVMFAFIGYWRTSAVVLCDLSSTAYYIGGIVESQIGKAAPWFILAVMLFSYCVRSFYIESCSMFVRGGVYRVVKEAFGPGMAKVSVSALMFDYVLTGPISGVSASLYVVDLANKLLGVAGASFSVPKSWGATGIAIAIVVYFYQSNVRGISESSTKALKIMKATTAMAVIIVTWCLVTMAVRPETRSLPPLAPDLSRKVDREGRPQINEVTKTQEDPLGWIAKAPAGEKLRPERIEWLSLFGALGIIIAFGHSVLAMSGEETLAQVYREVKAPKLRNFKRAAFIVFLYSLMLTVLITFFAVMIIPDDMRANYKDNLISGLTMSVVGPEWAKLLLQIFVVVIGFLILSGAVNTSIVGSNGVLNRVTEDGLLPDWFLRPQKRYGTTWRLLTLIAGLQIVTIVISRGDVILLGEAYAFGVVWSFVFKALSMLVLRFTEPGRYRGFRVPLNFRFGRREAPVGLALIFLVLLAAALANLMTKTVATIAGLIFTATFMAAFAVSEKYRRSADGEGDAEHEHLEQFKTESPEKLTPAALNLTRPHRKIVSVRVSDELAMLEKCLVETDPDTTEIVVVTAHAPPPGGPTEETDVLDAAHPTPPPEPRLTDDDRRLMTAVVNRSELAGKPIKPMVVLTEEPIAALIQVVRALGATELILGPPDTEAPDAQLDQFAARWSDACGARSTPLTIRVIGKESDTRREIAGGSQIPPAPDDDGETARSLAGSASKVGR
jgi:amino acid transporter